MTKSPHEFPGSPFSIVSRTHLMLGNLPVACSSELPRVDQWDLLQRLRAIWDRRNSQTRLPERLSRWWMSLGDLRGWRIRCNSRTTSWRSYTGCLWKWQRGLLREFLKHGYLSQIGKRDTAGMEGGHWQSNASEESPGCDGFLQRVRRWDYFVVKWLNLVVNLSISETKQLGLLFWM